MRVEWQIYVHKAKLSAILVTRLPPKAVYFHTNKILGFKCFIVSYTY